MEAPAKTNQYTPLVEKDYCARSIGVGDPPRAVSDFLENFEARLASVAMPDKKELIRRVVEKILVDKDQNKVTCYIKRLPSIDELGGLHIAGRGLLGEACSANGNRTRILALRGLRPNR